MITTFKWSLIDREWDAGNYWAAYLYQLAVVAVMAVSEVPLLLMAV